MADFYKKKMKTDPLPCPACQKPVGQVDYIYEDAEAQSLFYSCPECTFIFARPVLIPELNDRHMDGIENAEMFNSGLLKRLYIRLFINREVRKLKKWQNKVAPSFLDVGCGTGWTTFQYHQAGFDVTGLEPSKIRSKYARSHYGLNIISDYIENVSAENKYDIVMFRHIIEHFADPGAVVRKVAGLLNDDGLLFVIVPNINCLGRYLFGTKWSWVLPIHCNFFTPGSIRALLERSGYEVLECYQTPSPIYFPQSILRVFPNRLLSSLFNRYKAAFMLLFAPFAILGSLLGMGDNLNVIARKKIND
jgi:SAM-dependent methyltransferase